MIEVSEVTERSSDPLDTARTRRSVMRRTVLGLALAVSGVGVLAAADGLNVGDLTIHATGFAHARGHAVAKLFATGDNVLGTGRWQMSSSIYGGAAMFRFEALPAGSYAVVVFHDENDNGVIDHGLLGPSEPLGFSGGFRLSLVSGRPDFERLKFDFKPPAQMLELQVR